MKAKIICGAGNGDESKGLTVDNLCTKRSLVVRFSGGQNAGHTVIRDNIKHVFSSFGAGTLKGCHSYFTEDTTMYLPNLMNELNLLQNKGIIPKLFLHPLINITTFYDVAYNRYTEQINNHGSCGIGLAASMKRNIETPYKLYAIDFLNIPILKQKLSSISNYYKNKIQTMGLDISEYFDISNELGRDFYDTLNYIIENGVPFSIQKLDNKFLENYTDVIFEGSQGILLDMDHGIFPNVTYANTTSKNALKYVQKLGLDAEVYYITRCYQTRHGAGYMSNEKHIELINNEEEINVYNEYQKQFRIGEVDYDMLNYALQIDDIYHTKKLKKKMVISCLDQRSGFYFDIDKIKGINDFIYNASPKCDNFY